MSHADIEYKHARVSNPEVRDMLIREFGYDIARYLISETPLLYVHWIEISKGGWLDPMHLRRGDRRVSGINVKVGVYGAEIRIADNTQDVILKSRRSYWMWPQQQWKEHALTKINRTMRGTSS